MASNSENKPSNEKEHDEKLNDVLDEISEELPPKVPPSETSSVNPSSVTSSVNLPSETSSVNPLSETSSVNPPSETSSVDPPPPPPITSSVKSPPPSSASSVKLPPYLTSSINPPQYVTSSANPPSSISSVKPSIKSSVNSSYVTFLIAKEYFEINDIPNLYPGEIFALIYSKNLEDKLKNSTVYLRNSVNMEPSIYAQVEFIKSEEFNFGSDYTKFVNFIQENNKMNNVEDSLIISLSHLELNGENFTKDKDGKYTNPKYNNSWFKFTENKFTENKFDLLYYIKKKEEFFKNKKNYSPDNKYIHFFKFVKKCNITLNTNGILGQKFQLIVQFKIIE